MAQPATQHSLDTYESVALEAYASIVHEWQLPLPLAAALADMSQSTWKRARQPDYSGSLSKDQMLRLSAVVGIYKALKLYFGDDIAPYWIGLPNAGPLFDGARPIDTLIEDGLPQFLRVRNYLDALRGGA